MAGIGGQFSLGTMTAGRIASIKSPHLPDALCLVTKYRKQRESAEEGKGEKQL